ncbi:Signal transduction histidine kinase [Lachnospiraceae bacterium KHCPX20]|nr:Signal transduction histidine kinase [Lachnospiraceae bacterium KHCPX20]
MAFMFQFHKQKKEKKQHSLNRQIAGGIVLITFGAIAVVWIINSVFFGRFYIDRKQNVMENAYTTLCEADLTGDLYEDDYRTTFESLCANENLQIMVSSAGGKVLISSQEQNDLIMAQLYRSMFLAQSQEDSRVLYSDASYSILQLHDPRMDSDFLVLWGTLPDDNMIIIRSAMSSIEASVLLSSRFLVYAGIISIILAILVAILMTWYITRPVLRLTKISKEMTNLNFQAKYIPGKHPNEVDDLGIHMNQLSQTLEETICRLKQANADLQRDLDLRDQNERMRRDFSSSVSHELKTPLALIRGYAEGLLDSVNDDEESRRFYCEVIMDEADKMNHIVSQLLSLNQIEFGENVMTMEHFDLVEVTESVLRQNQLLMEQEGIKYTFEHPKNCFVWADSFFTEQVLTNYVTNAIHYCKDEKEIHLTITEQEGDVRIEVFNTGDPIPEDCIEHLWEKFYKVDKARTRAYGGSGIGLSVVKAIMDTFHKECGVINHNNGVTFWFELDK